ncbi:MAG: hypothetical protein C0598_03375 [Marinilabiliales bacterium]|nr:MAG: hypothetical protein C0598_03375 [Marinilabiliales bacterium]
MQCTRCGYFNSETVSTCIKCNTPLSKSEPKKEESSRKTQQLPNKDEVQDFLNKTVSEKGNTDFSASKTVADSGSGDFSASKTISDSGSSSFSASKTVSDFGASNEDEQNESSSPDKVEIIPCPNCSYPISGASKFCPNCSQDLTKEVVKEEKTKPSKKMNKERKPQKTVNIFASDNAVEEDSVKLTEIKQTGEKQLQLTSEDKKILLNNESLEQENNSAISSNVHAEIINFEGEYYLVNRTSAGTTFVAANTPKKITEGDIILIGNTIYRFDGK